MSVNEAYNFKPIDADTDTAGLLSVEQLSTLSAEGYQWVINLLPHDNEYAIAEEPALVAAQGIRYESIPVDFSAPSSADFEAFERLMLSRAAQIKTLVHCAANYRVSAFYGLFAYRHLSWSRKQVYEHIASIWDIAEYPVWQRFVEQHLN